MTRASHFLKTLCLLSAGILLSLSAYGEDFVVKVKKEFSVGNFTSQLSAYPELKVVDQHASAQLLLVRAPSSLKSNDFQETLKKIDAFEYAVPNIKFYINSLTAPNDPEYSKQWALPKVQATKAWERINNTVRPIVAVIDTGVDYNHEDLASQILRNDKGEIIGWNFVDNNNDPMDIISTNPRGNPGHGTHCAGIIGASVDNGIGVSGIAPKVRIMPLRFINSDGSGDLMGAIKAIDFAIQNQAQIISASWGAAVPRAGAKPLIEAIERAAQKGVIFVAAAANDGKSNDVREVYPANAGLPNVISVAASDESDAKPTWSNFGRAKVDISSPGAKILSTIPNNKYKVLSGTSMATPLVAGLLAVLLGQSVADGQTFNAPEFKALIQAHSQLVQIETACNCRLSAGDAMTAILEKKLTVVPNAGTYAIGDTVKFHAIGGRAPYHFTSSNPSAASITDDGSLKGGAAGSTTIKVTDADGKTAQTHEIFLANAQTPPPDGGAKCPLNNPQLCDLICKILPDLPWCKAFDKKSDFLSLN